MSQQKKRSNTQTNPEYTQNTTTGIHSLFSASRDSCQLTDIINNRIEMLEQRLNASDTYYRISSQNLKINEKERRDLQQKMNETFKQLDAQASQIEQKYNDIVAGCRRIAMEEVKSAIENSEKFNESSIDKSIKLFTNVIKQNSNGFQSLSKEVSQKLDELEKNPNAIDFILEMLTELEAIQKQQSEVINLFISTSTVQT